jgi:integrase
MKPDANLECVCCPNPKHKKTERATTLFIKFIKGYPKRRFSNKDPITAYRMAHQELESLRKSVGDGAYDPRDHASGNPLGLRKICEKYLKQKKYGKKQSEKTLAQTERELMRLCDFCFSKFGGEISIRELSTPIIREFECYLVSEASFDPHGHKKSTGKFSPKCIANNIDSIRGMWNYMADNEEFTPIKSIKWPVGDKENMAMRKTFGSRERQLEVVDEVKRIAGPNQRIWLAIRWLCIYTALRPCELRPLKENDVDLDNGVLYVDRHKNSRKKGPKTIRLLSTDIEILKEWNTFSELPIFRFTERPWRGSKVNPGDPFGPDLIYSYWKRACKNLGIEDIDLYGGTWHSTQRHYKRMGLSTEDCFRLSQHTTSKAGERYLHLDDEEMLIGYGLADFGPRTAAGPKPDQTKNRVDSIKPGPKANL